MDIQIRDYIITIIQLNGRIDAFSVGALRDKQEALLAEGRTRFIVDLHDVTFLDSAGISALVSLLKRARLAGGDVVLVSPMNDDAYRIFKLTRFDQVFKMVNSVAEAL